jgi:hypothetical protein
MRVLFCNKPGGAWGFVTESMMNALRDAGIETARWDGNPNTWQSFAPDIYIGSSGHKQPIPRVRACKVALQVNPFGPIKVEPNINESTDTIEWVKSVQPNVVFGYAHESDRFYWSNWASIAQWVPMATAGDATIFKHTNGTHDKFDIGYVGGRWPYKAQDIDAYLLPVLRDKSISHKVCGWGTWPEGLCSGQITDEEVPILLASCKIAPCISEPHTLEHGIDLPERVFKAALSGAVVVHDPAKGLDRYLPHAVVASNPKSFHFEIRSLLADQSFLPSIAETQRQDVLQAHTYHHRMATLMTSLGFNGEAELLLRAVERFK